MYVAVYVARLETPWVKSLKEKRSIIKPITEKLKTRFPVSVARLNGLNNHHWEEIGLSAISYDKNWLEQLLINCDDFIAGQSAVLRESQKSIERWDIS
ncbi:MAG TPA: DUF503 domain-containing protein [Trueperaceae bacterium]|nr:DUF503 domain-containing protein [Trueperaceae bacterium]